MASAAWAQAVSPAHSARVAVRRFIQDLCICKEMDCLYAKTPTSGIRPWSKTGGSGLGRIVAALALTCRVGFSSVPADCHGVTHERQPAHQAGTELEGRAAGGIRTTLYARAGRLPAR